MRDNIEVGSVQVVPKDSTLAPSGLVIFAARFNDDGAQKAYLLRTGLEFLFVPLEVTDER